MEIERTFAVEAAHWLPRAPNGHKCRRLHGHSFRITVTIRGEPDPGTGWVLDFADLKVAFAPLHETLDHQLLNEIDGLDNPTSENLAIWCWQRLADRLPGLWCIEVQETCVARCRIFRGDSTVEGE